jgi:hypothetical protein
MEETRERRICSDCGEKSAEVETAYSLIGKGWRVTRTRMADGRIEVRWRCPECWRLYKEARGATSGRQPVAKRHPESTVPPMDERGADAADVAAARRRDKQ